MPNFTKGKTFTSTEELTNTKLHQLVEDASMNVTAITSLTALADPVADTDTLPIADDSATAIRKVAASNFLKKNASSIYDAGTTRVTGVATPVAASDATTKAYVDSIAVVAGNLPTVTSGDNGSLLKVTSGVWTTTSSDAVSTSQIQNESVTGAKLENSGATAGTYGGSTSIPQITVDAKGRITSALSFNVTPADGTVSTAKVVDLAVTTAKIADSNITTAKLADASVTSSKLASGLAVPSQTGNSGKYLTTDGTTSSWGNVASGLTGFRNRIINGDMRIDQRNAGASVAYTTDFNGFTIDRFYLAQNGIVRSTAGRSAVVPSGQGFTNSFLTTITTADAAVTSGNKTMGYYYKLEGNNVSDLGWGTASAQTITISFWVRSSVAGTYSFTVTNTNFARNYNTSYTVNAANTWEKKTFTITGDTGATSINTTNGHAIGLVFDLGFSSVYESSTANAWQATAALALSGCTKLAATVGATWYITGLQLEAGSTATEFERRPIGTELALCQRYYETLANDTEGVSLVSYFHITNVNRSRWFFKVTKRAQPTVGLVSGTAWASSLVPTIYPSVDNAGFYRASSQFASSGASQAAGLYADAEL